MIPKIIHQTWKDTEVPEKWSKSPVEWKRHHPDWTYILWTDEDIRNHIATYHPEFLELHDNYKYSIQRADMIRYFVLYDYGGIYSDLDLYPTQSFEPYLMNEGDYFVFSANTPSVFTNSLMISPLHSNIMLEIIGNLQSSNDNKAWWSVGKHLEVMNTTGPLLLTNTLYDTQSIYNVLPKSKFNPYSIIEEFTEDKKNVVIHALEGSSWHSWDSSLYNTVLRNKVYSILLGIVVLLFIIFFALFYYFKHKNCICYK